MGLISGGGRRGRGGFGMAHLLLLIIGVSWLSFSSVEGVKCYICTGHGCKTDERDCHGSIGCAKQVEEVDGKEEVRKGCSGSVTTLGCHEYSRARSKEMNCICEGDLCNASTKKYSPSLMILLAASTLTALVTKFGVLRGGI